jgi:hypothetical protein
VQRGASDGILSPERSFSLEASPPEPIHLAAIELGSIPSPGAPRAKETNMNIAGFVGMTDEELIVHAMRNAQSLLAEHIDRGPFDAEEALTELSEILDRPDIVAATDRLCREYGLRPLK